MRTRKTVEVPAWASRFNIPFFYLPVSATSNDGRFNRRIIIKNKYNPAEQTGVSHLWAEVPVDRIF